MTYRDKPLKRYATAAALFLAAVAATPAPARAVSSHPVPGYDSTAPAVSSDPVPGFDSTVRAVAYSAGTLYVGGDFTAALVRGKYVERDHLAAVDAVTGELLPWAPAADGRVKALAVSGSSVYVAGEFGTIDGQRRDSLARIDAASGAASPAFKHHVDGRTYALAAANGKLYVGGDFTAIDAQPRTRLAAFSLSSGALDARFKPTADDRVEALAAARGRIYAGGRFHKVNGVGGYDRLVALNPSSGAVVPVFKPRPAVIVFAIAVTSDTVYTANGGQGGMLNAYTIGGAKRWTATFDGDAQAVTTRDGVVYAGGHFDHACQTALTGPHGVCLDGSDDRIKLAALDPHDGHLLDWTADANGIDGVFALASSPSLGTIAVGGAFTTIDGRPQKRLAQIS